MNKTTLALSLAALCTSSFSSFASTTDFFVGIGGGYQSIKADISDSELGSFDDKTRGGSFHLRGGLYLNDNHRFTATINHVVDSNLYRNYLNQEPDDISVGFDLGQTEYLVSYDYLHPISSDLSLFGGVSAGFVNNRLEGKYYDRTTGDNYGYNGSETDFTYGLQAGFQYKIIDNVSLDLQYRYMFESYSHTTHFGEGDSIQASVPRNDNISLTLDYRF